MSRAQYGRNWSVTSRTEVSWDTCSASEDGDELDRQIAAKMAKMISIALSLCDDFLTPVFGQLVKVLFENS
jgi:hypothetical protein